MSIIRMVLRARVSQCPDAGMVSMRACRVAGHVDLALARVTGKTGWVGEAIGLVLKVVDGCPTSRVGRDLRDFERVNGAGREGIAECALDEVPVFPLVRRDRALVLNI